VRARHRRLAAARPETAAGPRPPRRPALPAGQLYAMVLAHLRAHPTLDFSPAELANALDRRTSRGAIIKICRRLVAENLAMRTRQRPERYRAAPLT
jgi:hypothetical protein